jgi:hypothetical protein
MSRAPEPVGQVPAEAVDEIGTHGEPVEAVAGREYAPAAAGSTASVLRLQSTAGNQAVGRLLAQRSAARSMLQRDPPADKVSDADRIAVLEKKSAVHELDAKWRSRMGKQLSSYREVVYALTEAFKRAETGFQAAHSQQAQMDALKDQVLFALINVGAAGLAEPFLKLSLGGLGKGLSKLSLKLVSDTVEKLENPAIQAVQGATTIKGQERSNERSQNPDSAVPDAAGGGAGAGGSDPVLFLSGNLRAIEKHTQDFEGAFETRTTSMAKFTTDQWKGLNVEAQDAKYESELAALSKIAIASPRDLEADQTLAVKLELYFWAAWIKSHAPGVKGLSVGAKLASRMKTLGVESLANVHFDTTSWVFMDHKPSPPGFEDNMHAWAKSYSMKITKGN